MKLINLSTHEKVGGAAIAANRRHQALLRLGIDSTFAVAEKKSDDITVHSFLGKVGRALRPFSQFPDYVLPRLYKGKDETLFSPELFPSLLHRKIAPFPVDIIQLDWVAASFLPPFSLAKLTKPVVWTLHDVWAFTGGCHILKGCSRYMKGCGKCPQLGSTLAIDLSSISWRTKRNAYQKLNPTIVAPSRYLYNLAKCSALLSGFSIRHIPNGIDERQFFPVDKNVARQLLHLPADAKIVLFGAMSACSDKNKGYDLLLSALQHLKQSGEKNIHCAIFGATCGEPLPFPTHYLGMLNDSVSINLAYNAADVFVCPSREENFPNTVLESLSTGTPVAAFTIGGIPDMVMHMQNGYLATSYDSRELAEGLKTILESKELCETMSQNAREVVVERYAIEKIATQYKLLYESIGKQK